MSNDDLDAFRAELLRQKIVFEAELRRQREFFEEKLTAVFQELSNREADCRNLQTVVTILGKKVDLHEQLARRNAPTPFRAATPSSRHSDPDASETLPGEVARSRDFARRPSPLISVTSSMPVLPLHRAPSFTAVSRRGSPLRPIQENSLTSQRGNPDSAAPSPRVVTRSRSGNRRIHSRVSRTNSAHRLNGLTACDDW